MRWLFLLLFVLNGFYLVWNLQDAPVRAKDIGSVARNQGPTSGIQLLSEAGGERDESRLVAGQKCLFVGGYADDREVQAIARKLQDADLSFQPYLLKGESGAEHWLRLAMGDGPAPDPKVAEVVRNISGLRQKIIPCEGIATPE